MFTGEIKMGDRVILSGLTPEEQRTVKVVSVKETTFVGKYLTDGQILEHRRVQIMRKL